MNIVGIVAVDSNNGIGKDGKMPWSRIKEDMAHFKSVTMGHACIMGRKTWESIGRPLAGRHIIVLSENGDREALKIDNATVHLARTPELALEEAKKWSETVMICGGAEIYSIFGPRCSEFHVTTIGDVYPADTFFELGSRFVVHSSCVATVDVDGKPTTLTFTHLKRAKRLAHWSCPE